MFKTEPGALGGKVVRGTDQMKGNSIEFSVHEGTRGYIWVEVSEYKLPIGFPLDSQDRAELCFALLTPKVASRVVSDQLGELVSNTDPKTHHDNLRSALAKLSVPELQAVKDEVLTNIRNKS
jgi:hypothetical protein